MRAAPPLLSVLLILLYHSGWTYGLCKLENSTVASCHKLEDIKHIDTRDLEFLRAPAMREILAPGLFDNLKSLKHLDLSGGDLRKIEPGSFRALSNLRSLNLGDNRIAYLELAALEGLAHLRSLNLRRNAIRQLPPAVVRLKNLRHLDVHGNPLDCNCATLKVRDLIVQRGVTVSKKVACAGPGNMKGTSLMKPSATLICSLEQQDREMQNDQAEGSGTGLEPEDTLDEYEEEEEEEEGEEEDEDDVDDEYVEVHNKPSEKPSKELEIETPFPAVSADSMTGSPAIEPTVSPTESSVTSEETTSASSFLQPTTEDEEIFFDTDDKKEQASTTEMSRKEENFKDALFYPVWGSGDGEETSGEGSGTGWAHFDEEKTGKEDATEGPSLLDMLFGSFLGTAAPTENKDENLEEEEFIDASSTKVATEEESIVSRKSHPLESDVDKVTTETIATSVPVANGVEVIKSAGTDDGSKSGNVKAKVESLNNERAEVSPTKQSKKGMGSYVVLAALLAVLAALIGFAAYKGDFCRKKRKRSDVENGTELKDMQKSLLPDAGNATQPKIASNGNAENVPLVDGIPDGENAKVDKPYNDDYQTQETPRSLNGTAEHPDPVKPPRKLIGPQEVEQKVEERPRVDVNSLRENFLADRTSPAQPSASSVAASNGPTTHTSELNGPPLSPGAQRVKITMQEIPESVPKTPILITRTAAGENLVKTP